MLAAGLQRSTCYLEFVNLCLLGIKVAGIVEGKNIAGECKWIVSEHGKSSKAACMLDLLCLDCEDANLVCIIVNLNVDLLCCHAGTTKSYKIIELHSVDALGFAREFSVNCSETNVLKRNFYDPMVGSFLFYIVHSLCRKLASSSTFLWPCTEFQKVFPAHGLENSSFDCCSMGAITLIVLLLCF